MQADALNAKSALNSAAASFGTYGRVRQKPKVGDAILLNYDRQAVRADHVAIVVKVFANGNIVSIGGNERTADGEVAKDPPPALPDTTHRRFELVLEYAHFRLCFAGGG